MRSIERFVCRESDGKLPTYLKWIINGGNLHRGRTRTLRGFSLISSVILISNSYNVTFGGQFEAEKS